MASNSLAVLQFLLQDIKVCIDLRYIEKILPLPLLKTIPSSPNYFVGLMNFKNNCIPIIDLAISMGISRNKIYPLDIPILLCSDGIHRIGLIVDQVLELDQLDESNIEKSNDFASNNSPFCGFVSKETTVLLLINMEWVFSLKVTQNPIIF